MMIKAIAIDMDGTFLDPEQKFDYTYYMKIKDRLDKHNIQLVFASGNQMKQIRNHFNHPINVVAENGTYIGVQDEVIHIDTMSKQQIHAILDILECYCGFAIVICGTKNAYITQKDQEMMSILSQGFSTILYADNLREIKEEVLKITLLLKPNFDNSLFNSLMSDLAAIAQPTTSGFGYIDIMKRGINKASGLAILNQRWHLSFDDWAAFGDSNNDLQMLRSVCYSFAMKNANEEVKAIAKQTLAYSNAENGVLRTIEKLLDEIDRELDEFN